MCEHLFTVLGRTNDGVWFNACVEPGCDWQYKLTPEQCEEAEKMDTDICLKCDKKREIGELCKDCEMIYRLMETHGKPN